MSLKRAIHFSFRTDGEERQMIARIAERLERSEGDSVRLLVRAAAREMGVAPQPPERIQADSDGSSRERMGGKRAA